LAYNAGGERTDKESPMHRTPTELGRLTIFTATELTRRRRARGWKLTHPEALAIICDEMHGDRQTIPKAAAIALPFPGPIRGDLGGF
jgi:hypothetical protein